MVRQLLPLSSLDGSDWAYVFGEQQGSSSGPLSFTRADVEALYLADDGKPDGADWVAVGRLKDGRYFHVRGWCDYTGWGCRDSNSEETWPTWGAFVHGCGDDIRAKLGLGLDGLGSSVTYVDQT